MTFHWYLHEESNHEACEAWSPAGILQGEVLTGNREEDFSEIGVSVLNEIGNIVASAYMNSITKFTGLNLLPSVPAMAYDMLGAILSTMVLDAAQYEDKVLEIKTNFIKSL